jgi:hypothetical protein
VISTQETWVLIISVIPTTRPEPCGIVVEGAYQIYLMGKHPTSRFLTVSSSCYQETAKLSPGEERNALELHFLFFIAITHLSPFWLKPFNRA